jgi:hypothetical protein
MNIVDRILKARTEFGVRHGTHATHVYLGHREIAEMVDFMERNGATFPAVSGAPEQVSGLLLVRVPEASHFAVARSRAMLPAPAKA